MSSEKRSPRTESSSSRSGNDGRFIPNFTQLQESLATLPAPEEWMEDSYTCRITADSKRRSLVFDKMKINRGDRKVSRWVYNGKVLIRNRDI